MKMKKIVCSLMISVLCFMTAISGVSAASYDTSKIYDVYSKVVEYYKTRSEYELEIVNVFAARGKKLGEYNLMMGQNPVYIMTALKKGE